MCKEKISTKGRVSVKGPCFMCSLPLKERGDVKTWVVDVKEFVWSLRSAKRGEDKS